MGVLAPGRVWWYLKVIKGRLHEIGKRGSTAKGPPVPDRGLAAYSLHGPGPLPLSVKQGCDSNRPAPQLVRSTDDFKVVKCLEGGLV